MIHPKHLVQLAKKWQRMASTGRRKVTAGKEIKTFKTSVAAKGNCIMYTVDGRRFEIPLAYLSTMVIGELLRMSQEEFGFTNAWRITLPCEAAIMEYVMRLLQGKASEYVERTVLRSLVVP